MNRFSDIEGLGPKRRTDCVFLNGFVEFENTVNHGSTVNFGADSVLRQPVVMFHEIVDHRSFFRTKLISTQV